MKVAFKLWFIGFITLTILLHVTGQHWINNNRTDIGPDGRPCYEYYPLKPGKIKCEDNACKAHCDKYHKRRAISRCIEATKGKFECQCRIPCRP
ncbi:unnamed protein product [Brassica rapa subsp. trilocularis]